MCVVGLALICLSPGGLHSHSPPPRMEQVGGGAGARCGMGSWGVATPGLQAEAPRFMPRHHPPTPCWWGWERRVPAGHLECSHPSPLRAGGPFLQAHNWPLGQ